MSRWITFGIIKSINHKDKMYQKLKMTDTDSQQFIMFKSNLNAYNNISKKRIWLQKKLYYEACLKKYKNDMRKILKTINEVLCKTKKKKISPDFFKDGNKQITDKLEIANRFNAFFTNVGTNLAKKLVNKGNKIFTDFLVHRYTSQLKFQNINKEQVIKIIDNMKPKTSSGFDKISMKLIKSIKNVLAEQLTIVINQMLNTGKNIQVRIF